MTEIIEALFKLVSRFEGCRLTAYRDIVGIWTIGWGETLGVTEGMVWTQQQADDRLRARLLQFLMAAYKKCPQLWLEPNYRVIACTSLAYNIGIGAFGASSVCRATYRCEYAAAGDAFLLWDKAGGRKIRGLTLRRQQERTVYLGPA